MLCSSCNSLKNKKDHSNLVSVLAPGQYQMSDSFAQCSSIGGLIWGASAEGVCAAGCLHSVLPLNERGGWRRGGGAPGGPPALAGVPPSVVLPRGSCHSQSWALTSEHRPRGCSCSLLPRPLAALMQPRSLMAAGFAIQPLFYQENLSQGKAEPDRQPQQQGAQW